MLSDRQIELLILAGRLEVAYARDFTILTGGREYTADRKRLASLIEDGYMAETWWNAKKVFFLTSKGIRSIDTTLRRPFDPKGRQTTDHSLYVAELAAFLHLLENISCTSMIFDREMDSLEVFKPQHSFHGKKIDYDRVHAPDIAVGDRCFEVELTQKSKTRMTENFRINARLFSKQIWVIPERLKSLQQYILSLAEKHKCYARIMSIEQMENYLDNVDIHFNERGDIVDLLLKTIKPEKNVLEVLS